MEIDKITLIARSISTCTHEYKICVYYFYVGLYGTRFARVRPGNVACSESFVCVYPEGNVIKWGFNWNSQNIFKEFTKTINEYLQYLLKLYEQFTEVDHLHTNRIMNGPCPFLRTYTVV